MIDNKFKELANIGTTLSTEDNKRLLPLALEALNIKVEDLPQYSRGDALREAVTAAKKAYAKEKFQNEGPDLVADDRLDMYTGIEKILTGLGQSNQLESTLNDMYVQKMASSYSSDQVEVFGSDEEHRGGEPGSEVPEFTETSSYSETPETNEVQEVQENVPEKMSLSDRLTSLGITLTGNETTEQVTDMLTALEFEGKLTMEESTDLFGEIETNYPLNINDQIAAINKENADLEAENQVNRQGVEDNRAHQELITEVDHAQNTQGHTNAIEQLSDNITINEEIIAENRKKIEALQVEKANFIKNAKESVVEQQNTDITVVDQQKIDLPAVINKQPTINISQLIPTGGNNTGGSDASTGNDTTTTDSTTDSTTTTDTVITEEPVTVDPTEAFYASETILGEHSDEKFPFTKHGMDVYKPRERGIHETDEEYVAYLKNYYETLFGKFKEMDDALAKVTEIENKINEEKAKMQEAFNKINELKAGFGVPFASATTPEEMSAVSAKFMEELQTAIKNYEFYKIRIEELNKELAKAKENYDGLTFKPTGKTNNQNKPNQNVAGLLTDGRKINPIGDDPFKVGPLPPREDPVTVTRDPQKELPDPNKHIAGYLPPHVDPEIPRLPAPEPEPKPPVPPVPPKPTEVTEQETTKQGRRLEVILHELVDGLGIQMKDNKTYNLSNLQVAGTMKAKLKQGNYIYNTVAALNIGTYLSMPINFIRKVAGKIRMTPAAKERIDALRLRISELSEEDLMVIYKEYRADRAGQNRDMDLVNTLLGERIGKFVEEKVNAINARLTELYTKIVEDFKKLSELKTRADAAQSDEEKANIENEYNVLLVGKCDIIREIESLQKEGREWYSGGGHGFEEDMKATKSKMTFIGKRFSKSNNANEELAAEEARLVSNLDAALAANNDEEALIAFLQHEKLESDNTIIKNSIFGKRSVGDRYYEPLVTKMDYRNDPFVQDLMGAVATMGGIINIVGSVKNAAAVKAQTDAANAQIDAANQAKANAEAQIHDYGDKIQERSEVIYEGQQAQAVENELAHMNTAERYTLDANNWGLGTSSYTAMDNATHAAYNARYADIQSHVNGIADSYSSGALSLTDALRSMEGVAREQQQGFIDMLTQYQPTLTQYAASHPQFDLTGLTEGVDYLINHPNAISDAVGAQASISEIGRQLQQMTLGGDIQGIQIATTIWPQIVGTGSAYILATNVANQMKANTNNGRYGNAVIEMMQELDGEALSGMSR